MLCLILRKKTFLSSACSRARPGNGVAKFDQATFFLWQSEVVGACPNFRKALDRVLQPGFRWDRGPRAVLTRCWVPGIGRRAQTLPRDQGNFSEVWWKREP